MHTIIDSLSNYYNNDYTCPFTVAPLERIETAGLDDDGNEEDNEFSCSDKTLERISDMLGRVISLAGLLNVRNKPTLNLTACMAACWEYLIHDHIIYINI